MPCLWIAIRLKARGASGSPSTAVTLTPERGLRPAGSARTNWPSPAPPSSAIGAEWRTRLSIGASHSLPAPSRSITPMICSPSAGSFFIGWAIQPVAVSSVRASTRSPTFSATMGAEGSRRPPAGARPALALRSTSRRRGGTCPLSGVQLSGTASGSPSSISTTRSTVTFGTPPIA